jgi:hypothetical protein
MKIVEGKKWIVPLQHSAMIEIDLNKIKEELNDYTFKGKIDFSYGISFLYDLENKIVLENYEASEVVIDNEIKKIEKKVCKAATQRYPLSKNQSLQDFFNDNKDAECIVFCLGTPSSIFHAGYCVRVYVDNGIENENNNNEGIEYYGKK